MYLAEKNWDEMIGGSEDSMTLGEYLADKEKREISLKEIFEAIGKKIGKIRTDSASESGTAVSINCS